MTPIGSDQSAAFGRVVGVQGEPRLVNRNVMVEPAERGQVVGVVIA